MKIVIVSPTPTHPQTSGNRVRILRLAEMLQEAGNDVCFFLLRTATKKISPSKQYWGSNFRSLNVIRRSVKSRLYTGIIKCERKWYKVLRRRRHHRIDEWFDLDWTHQIVNYVTELEADIVIAEYIFSTRFFSSISRNVVKVVDTHDVFTHRDKMFLENNRAPSWFSTTPRREKKALNRADIVFAITNQEKKFFEDLGASSVFTIGHKLVLKDSSNQSLSNVEFEFGFIGSGNAVNIAGWDWLYSTVLPKIWEVDHRARICVGGGISEKLSAETLDPRVVVMSFLDDVKDFYDNVHVVINPLTFGTGLKIKSIEALEYGKFLVSTRVGIEGLPVQDAPFMVADDPDDFARHCLNSMQRVKDEVFIKNLQEYSAAYNKSIQDELAMALGLHGITR